MPDRIGTNVQTAEVYQAGSLVTTTGISVLGAANAVASTTGATGGAGYANVLTAQSGGASSIATTGTGGAGGSWTITGGAGGTAAAAVTAQTGGAGGAVALVGGAGAAAAALAGTDTGGVGGSASLTAGAGGSGAEAGGAGGSVLITAGAAGAGGAVNGGSIRLTAGLNQSAGVHGRIEFGAAGMFTAASSAGTAPLIALPSGFSAGTPKWLRCYDVAADRAFLIGAYVES